MDSLSNFSPSRLTVARQRRGLTMRALADGIGVSSQAISFYESGEKPPATPTLHQMAFCLRFPLGFFYAPEVDIIPAKAISFRSRRSMTAELRNRALASGEISTGIISPELRHRFKFPEIDIPDFSMETPQVAAKLLRDYWKLGQAPISNMVHLLEAKGVETYWINEDSSCVDAVSFWRDDRPFIVFNSKKTAGDRARFDSAHELAHLVLHRHDRVVDGRQVEAEADDFASAFLLPELQFRSECPKLVILRQFFPLKKRWGVSIQAMVRRSKDIGIISPWQYECACKEISELKWRTKEPVPLEREQSALHVMAYERMAAKDIFPEDFARRLYIGLEDLHEMTPAAKNYDRPKQQPRKAQSQPITRGGLTLWSADDAA